MSNSARETELLIKCIRDDATGELHRQEQTVARTEREERCLRSAVWVMAALTGFALVGAGHSLVLLKNQTPYHSELVIHGFRILGVASLISLWVFVVLWIIRRERLKQQRAQCRALVQELLAARALPRTPGV
jgi:hypothetical protein